MAKKSKKVVPINSTPGWDEQGSNTWEAGKPKTKWGEYKRCYESHPALKIVDHNGHTREIFGGSCSTPIHSDADVYVGLDYSMMSHPQRFPWVSGAAIHYEIQDMGIPKNAAEFKELITYLEGQILGGKKVHIGCIGGHGRTGILLSALVAQMTNEKDPITYVRENYCKKAVESAMQVKFLMKYFGCKEVVGAKQSTTKKIGKTSKAANAKINPVFAQHCIFGDLDVT